MIQEFLGRSPALSYALAVAGQQTEGCEMLDGGGVAAILRLHRLGWGKKRIAGELGFSVNTVKRYVRSGGVPTAAVRKRNTGKTAGLSDWLRDEFLKHEGNADVVRQELWRHHSLELSLRQVERLVKGWRDEITAQAIATVRFETKPGKQMQLDFGQRDVMIDGRKLRVFFLAASLCYSRRVFVYPTLSERREDWFAGIEAAFRYFGGRPEELLVDNASPLVVKHDRVTGQVEFTAEFSKFCQHWGIKPKACRPRRPRTKGKVERMVGYVKKNAIAGHEFATWEGFRAHLDWWQRDIADKRKLDDFEVTPVERFEDERTFLRPIEVVRPFAKVREVARVVSSELCVDIDTNRYSVPWSHIGKTARIKIEDGWVRIFIAGHEVAEHPQLIGRHLRSIDSQHFSGLGVASRARPPTPVSPPNGFHRPLSAYASALGGVQ